MIHARCRILALLLLAAACGKEKPSTPPGPAPAATGANQHTDNPAAPGEGEQAAARERAAKIEALRAKKAELEARVKRLAAAAEETIRDGDAKREALPDISKYRRRLMTLMRDRNIQASRLHSMQKQFEEVKRLAESSLTDEIRALHEQEKALDRKYNEALSGWKQDIADAQNNVVEESPVRKELATLRAVKHKWFDATPLARSGEAGEKERRIINEGFRAWLGEDPAREALVARVLTQRSAPEGSTPDRFDFTDLDFFVLIEMLEDTLDRANIAVEKKLLSENLQTVRKIEKELEALREKLAQKMQQGGGELERYEDLAARLPGQKRKVDELESAVREYRKIFDEAQAARDALDQKETEAIQARDEARKQLRETLAALRALGA